MFAQETGCSLRFQAAAQFAGEWDFLAREYPNGAKKGDHLDPCRHVIRGYRTSKSFRRLCQPHDRCPFPSSGFVKTPGAIPPGVFASPKSATSRGDLLDGFEEVILDDLFEAVGAGHALAVRV